MTRNGRPVERAYAEVVSGGGAEPPAIERLGRVARIGSQARINRLGAITGQTAVAAQTLAAVYGVAGEWADEGVRRLERQDAVMQRLGEAAQRDHQVAKDNLRLRLQRLAEVAADVVHDTYQRDLEDLLSLPDAAFYDPSLGERFAAWWWDDTSVELERRGLGRLTPGERLKEVFVGGVIDAKITAHDRQQTAERRERLDLVRQLDAARAQAVALAAHAAELEDLVAGERPTDPGDERDDEVRARVNEVEELLRQVSAAAQEPVPARRRRARELEVIDAEPIV